MTQYLEQFHVGIDVSKSFLDIHILPDNLTFRVENNTKGIAQLSKRLPTPSAIVLEATGGYERLVARKLHQCGFAVCVINPTLLYHFKRSINKQAKTDGIDAETLALFAKARPELRYGLIGAEQQQLLDWQRAREQLKKALMQERNRLAQTVDRYAKTCHQSVIKTMLRQIARLEKRMLALIQQLPHYRQQMALLCSIPGIAQTLSLTLIAALPEMGCLKHKPLQRLVGVAPINNDSGTFQGKRFIQGGRQAVRNALYMAALVSTQCNPAMKRFYLAKQQQGKPKKVALVACMAKLLRIVNSVIRQQQPFCMPN